MDNTNLKDLLKKLHEGLSATDQVDDELRGLLKELDHDIRQLLSGERGPDDPVFAGMSARSQAMTAKFAAKHPRLEPILRELGSMLDNIGV
jgi:succinate dehydrogenase flavin-adding protein (antitoxin of CptAB toxin-antitoxin module)